MVEDGAKCVKKCEYPCSTCLDGEPTSCTECYGGYTLVANGCENDLTCNTAGDCEDCPEGYTLLNG